MEWIDEKKKMKIKKILSYKGKVYSIIFTMLEDEIREMLRSGYSKIIIVKVLNEELETNINYFTFIKWFDKNIKQNNNSLIKNSLNEEMKKNETNEVKQKQEIEIKKEKEVSKKEKNKNWKDVIFPQIEVACEGMKKANLRM